MRPRLPTTGLVALVLLLASGACTGDAETAIDSPAPTTALTPSTPAPTPSPSRPSPDTSSPTPTQRAAPSDAAMPARCAAYLDYIAARDVADFEAAIRSIEDSYGPTIPPDVRAAIEGLHSAEPGEIAEAAAALRRAIRPGCAEQYERDVVGMTDNETAARQFYDAVVAGDREAAARIAPLDVLAEFAPWQPVPADEDADTPRLTSVTERSFTMVVEPTVSVFCETTDGAVVSCAFGE